MKQFLVQYVLWPLAFLFLMSSSEAYSFPYKGLDITIQPSVSEQFDDNLTFSKKDKKSDFVTRLRINLKAEYIGKRQGLLLQGDVIKSFHARFKDIKDSSELISATYTNDLSKYVEVQMSDVFSHTETASSFEEEFGRVISRQEKHKNVFGFKLINNISQQYKLTVRYNNTQNYFPDDKSDSSSNGVHFNLNYMPGPEVTYFLTYSYSKSSFSNHFQSARIGIKRYIIKKIYFDGSVGVGHSSASVNGTDMSIDMALTDEISRRSFVKIMFSKEDKFSDFGGDLFKSWQVKGKYSNEFSIRLYGNAEIFYGKGSFDSSSLKRTYYGVTLFASYYIAEDVIGSLSFSSSKLDLNVGNSGYLKNTVSINLSKTF